MMSPANAFSNCVAGTSTFLFTPRMSVNWSRRKRTLFLAASARMSCFVAPVVLGTMARVLVCTMVMVAEETRGERVAGS